MNSNEPHDSGSVSDIIYICVTRELTRMKCVGEPVTRCNRTGGKSFQFSKPFSFDLNLSTVPSASDLFVGYKSAAVSKDSVDRAKYLFECVLYGPAKQTCIPGFSLLRYMTSRLHLARENVLYVSNRIEFRFSRVRHGKRRGNKRIQSEFQAPVNLASAFVNVLI